jgi:acetyl-CoA carboxylase, biotin carboxylase subunit
LFKKILIANRGEIAARIIRTCKKMNIQTVAIYSDADKDAPFVEMADESYPLEGNRVQETYLNMEKIFSIAKRSSVDAIHPGYGFLSENPQFAKQCADHGIVFIGPSPTVMEKMGDKVLARQTMKQAGVPIVPGTDNPIDNLDEAVQIAETIGYPIMLKASSGGGGIGMEIIHTEDELKTKFNSLKDRVSRFFADGAMYIEKVIEHAHHIEIQGLADHYGNVIHLFDRECSIQRRHQKVIEEAPSPFISKETREKMGEVAVKAAQAISYTNAGTLEFLVDAEENFYFLEMNTRLQVEHPVTEEITGIDIVEKQIEIAYGKELHLKQADISIQGHSIEARIYAEDPNTFFPAPGTITNMQLPEGPTIRHELGMKENMTITPFYDPMIAKLIVKGDNRNEAIGELQTALQNYIIEGTKSNIPLLQKIAATDAFIAGNTNTSFIKEYIQKKN